MYVKNDIKNNYQRYNLYSLYSVDLVYKLYVDIKINL